MTKPSQAKAGTLLIGGGQYDRPPLFVFEFEGEPHGFDLADPASGEPGFRPRNLASANHFYLGVQHFNYEVDISDDSKVSPTRSDISPGLLVVSKAGPCFAVREKNRDTFFISIAGEISSDVEVADVVGFSRWRITIPGPNDTSHIVYEAGHDQNTDSA
ncbi:hypothetical protein ACSQ76_08375 [Roseovarius sp. B08]|uniref:hypothetical protein n=1 Tax=Roseovarius sp. B08 TaxID=3449223 RepID=UPI003EDB74C9